MGFRELIQVGLLTAFWNFGVPFVSICAYLSLFLGFGAQWLVMRWSRRRWIAWLPVVVGTFGILICECLWHTIIGWDRLVLDFIYLLFISQTLGVLLGLVFRLFPKHKK